jgi:hypothetical protein
LLEPPINGNFPDNTTYNITGACNGPLYVTEDRVRFVGDAVGAAIVLPAGIPNPDDCAIFVDGAHDVRIQDLLIDASAWSTAASLGSDACGVLARNAFARLIDSDVQGATIAVDVIRNANIRMQGTVNITDFLVSGVEAGDNSVVDTKGQVNISSTRTASSRMNGVAAYRGGTFWFREGLTVNMPPSDEDNDFEPVAIYSDFHGQVGSGGTININGFVYAGSESSVFMGGGTIVGDMQTEGGTITLSHTNVTGKIKLFAHGFLSTNNATINGDIDIQNASVASLRWSQHTDGQISVNSTSTLQTEDSSVGPILASTASAVNFTGGQFSDAEFRNGSFGDFYDASALGNIKLVAPANLEYEFEEFGTLNGNTIYLCGNTTSLIDPVIESSGTVSDSCGP